MPNTQQTADGVWRRFRQALARDAKRLAEHWIIGVAVGLLIALGVWYLEPFAPIQVVSKIGADIIGERAAARGESLAKLPDNPIAYITVDDETLERWGAKSWRDVRPKIAQLTAVARRSGAKVVVLDVEFSLGDPTTKDAVDIAPIFKGPGARLILSAPLDPRISPGGENTILQLTPPPNYPSPLPDGITYNYPGMAPDIVRGVPPAAQVYDERTHRSDPMPSISVAVVEALHDQHATTTDPSALLRDKSRAWYSDLPIRFFIPPSQRKPSTAITWPWYRVVSASQVEPDMPALKGAVVFIGQDNKLAADYHMTPLGNMPGVLVHANAVASMLSLGLNPIESVWAGLCVEVLLVLASATLTLPYWWLATRHERSPAREGSLAAARAFGTEITLLAVTTVFIFNLAALAVIIVGSNALLNGVVVGNLAATLGVALEAFVHVGGVLYKFLHYHTERLVGHLFRSRRTSGVFVVVLAGGLLVPSPGRADEAVVGYVQLDKGDRVNVIVSHPGKPSRRGREAFNLFLGDLIEVTDPGTSVHAMIGGGIGMRPPTPGGISVGPPYPIDESFAPLPSHSYLQILGNLWAMLLRDPQVGPIPGPSLGTTRTENNFIFERLFRAGVSSDAILQGRVCEEPAMQAPGVVRVVQIELRNKGLYDRGAPDGRCGSRTEDAIGKYVDAVNTRYVVDTQYGTAATQRGEASPGYWFAGRGQPSVAPNPLLGFGKFKVESPAGSYLLIWSGGVGPFSIFIADLSANRTIRLGRTTERAARVAIDFPQPGRLVEVRLLDEGASDSATDARQPLLLFTLEGVDGRGIPAPEGVPDLALAAWLIAGADPAWRLEGVRRLVALADANNNEAKEMVGALVRQDSGAPASSPGRAGASASVKQPTIFGTR